MNPVLLAAAAAVLLAGLAAGLQFTSSRALWKTSRASIIGRIAAWLLARRAEPRWGPAEACAWECPESLASRLLLRLVEKWGCPPPRVAEALATRGLMPPLAAAAARNCGSPPGMPRLFEALRALLGYSPRGEPVVYACARGVTAVRVGGETYSSLDLPEPLRSRLPKALPARVGGLVVSYGCGGPGAVRLESLALRVLPEAPPSVPWLLYHLGLDPELARGGPEGLLDAVTRSARRLVWLSKRYLGDREPWEAVAVREWLGEEPVECPARAKITDKPVLGCPYYSPYRLAPMGRLRGELASIVASLESRGGNPVRAAVNLALHGRRDLAEKIAGIIVPGPGPAQEDSVQVEPWYAGCARVQAEQAECMRPHSDCTHWQGPGPVEWWAWRLGIRVEPPECPARGPRPAQALPSAKPRVLAAGENHGLGALLWATENAGEGRVLAVVPSEPVASIISRVTGLALAHECPSCERAVTSWERLELEPWIVLGWDTVVYLYPEKFPKPGHVVEPLRRGRTGEYLHRAEAWVRELATRPGIVSLSWLLESRPGHETVGRAGTVEEPRVDPEPIIGELEGVLRRWWSPDYRLRPHQALALRALLAGWRPPPGRPVLGVFPTGYGKSAVFQIAGLTIAGASGGYVLVVSPLRALIRDQVEGLLRRGIPAARIDSSVSGKRRKETLEAAALGLIDFLYVTPERFQDPLFYSVFTGAPPALAVLDEAHTVVKWGGSFRPSYYYAARAIADLRGEAGEPHLALFTASAPGRIARMVLDLVGAGERVEELRLGQGEEARLPEEWSGLILRAPTVRENIFFSAVRSCPGEQRLRDLENYIRELARRADEQGGSWLGVVFTSYVKSERHPWANADRLAEWVEERTGLPAIAYHGQLGDAERRRREDAIYRASRTGEGPRVIVATKAFGMGVDIPNIRWIIHVLPSDSVEDYYQEAGRAGRDGLPSIALHLYAPQDFEDKRRAILSQRPRPSSVLRMYNTLVGLHEAVRRREGGWPVIPLPLDLLPSPVRALKAIDYLRSAGLLDYWVVQAGIAAYHIPETGGAAPGPEILPWSLGLGGRIYLGPRLRQTPPTWRLVEPRFYTCDGARGPVIPVRVEAAGRSIESAECDEWKSRPLPARPQVLLAVLSPEEKHGRLNVLPPELFAHVSRLAAQELEALDKYERIVSEAALLAAKSGWDSPEVDRYLKREIDRALSEPPPPTRERPPTSILGATHVCPTLAECAGLAAEIIRSAELWLGSPHAVSLALQDEADLEPVRRAYERLTGRELEARYHGVYKRVLQASRHGPHALMDYGFIVVLARSHHRTVDALRRLDGYPYHARLLYHTRP